VSWHRAGALWGAALVMGVVATSARAQTLTVSANPIVITPPGETEYDAASPNNVTASTSMTMTLVCPSAGGNNGCEIDFSYTGATLLVDYRVTGATGCNSGFTTPAFATVPSVVTKLVDMGKNGTCTITVLFRVRALAYNVQQAGTTYLQNIALVGKRQ
jgi:hypothetical protein